MPRMDSPRRSPACGKFAALVSIEFGASRMLASRKKQHDQDLTTSWTCYWTKGPQIDPRKGAEKLKYGGHPGDANRCVPKCTSDQNGGTSTVSFFSTELVDFLAVRIELKFHD